MQDERLCFADCRVLASAPDGVQRKKSTGIKDVEIDISLLAAACGQPDPGCPKLPFEVDRLSLASAGSSAVGSLDPEMYAQDLRVVQLYVGVQVDEFLGKKCVEVANSLHAVNVISEGLPALAEKTIGALYDFASDYACADQLLHDGLPLDFVLSLCLDDCAANYGAASFPSMCEALDRMQCLELLRTDNSTSEQDQMIGERKVDGVQPNGTVASR